MFRSIKAIVGLSVLGLIAAGGIWAWTSGFAQRVIDQGIVMANGVIAFFNQPWGWEQLLASSGSLIGTGAVIFLIFFAITELGN